MKKNIYLASLLLYSVACVFLLYLVMTNVSAFSENRTTYTNATSIQNGAMDAASWIPWLSDWDETVAEADVFKARSNRNYVSIQFYALLYAASSLILILLSIVLFKGTKVLWKYLSLSMLLISTICLVIGVFAPLMELAVYAEDLHLGGVEFLTFNGRTYFIYQLKSIIGLIGLLIAGKSYMLAAAIGLFSVLLPLTKLTISVMQIFSDKAAKNKTGNFITNYLGKWSMADVFVVAILLAILAVSQMGAPGIEVDSLPLVGLYYFTAYCVMSLLTSYFIKNHVKSSQEDALLMNSKIES